MNGMYQIRMNGNINAMPLRQLLEYGNRILLRWKARCGGKCLIALFALTFVLTMECSAQNVIKNIGGGYKSFNALKVRFKSGDVNTYHLRGASVFFERKFESKAAHNIELNFAKDGENDFLTSVLYRFGYICYCGYRVQLPVYVGVNMSYLSADEKQLFMTIEASAKIRVYVTNRIALTAGANYGINIGALTDARKNLPYFYCPSLELGFLYSY